MRRKLCDSQEISKMDTQKLLCILEGENNIDSSAEVYYCTQEGKVYGEL